MLPTPPEAPTPVRLRHWRVTDAADLAAAWDDPTIVRWNPPPEHPNPVAWIEGAEQRWHRRLSLDLVIEDVGTFAGEVGLRNFTGGDGDAARAELGVWVVEPRRRRGLAVIAVDALARWALEADGLGLAQVWARTDPRNRPAEHLFERLGWARLGRGGGATVWSRTG